MDHHHYSSPMISPTAHHALRTVISGPVDISCNWPSSIRVLYFCMRNNLFSSLQEGEGCSMNVNTKNVDVNTLRGHQHVVYWSYLWCVQQSWIVSHEVSSVMKVVQSAPVKSFLVLDRKSPDTMLHGAYYMQHIGCLLDASGNIGYTDSLEFFYPAPVQSHFSHQVVKNL